MIAMQTWPYPPRRLAARSNWRPEHPQIALPSAPVPDTDGRECLYVDILLADPLLRMWRAGIGTYWSCQGSPPADPPWVDGYCTIADASRTYEAMQIIGVALGVHTFRLDTLSHDLSDTPGVETIRWNLPRRLSAGGSGSHREPPAGGDVWTTPIGG